MPLWSREQLLSGLIGVVRPRDGCAAGGADDVDMFGDRTPSAMRLSHKSRPLLRRTHQGAGGHRASG